MAALTFSKSQESMNLDHASIVTSDRTGTVRFNAESGVGEMVQCPIPPDLSVDEIRAARGRT